MSFFGFDASLPRDRQGQSSSRGIFEQHDPFGGLGNPEGDEGAVLNFEETYDGLGHQLNESGDTFNDDTFGGDEPLTREGVGRDYDFAGQTAKARNEFFEEQGFPQARQSQPMQYSQAARPKRTGYEAYKEPECIPKLEADASIWGSQIGRKPVEQQRAQQDSAAGRRMISLEEVEAMMRNQSRPTPPPPVQNFDQQSQGLRDMLGVGGSSQGPMPPQQEPLRPMQILQRQQSSHQEPQMQPQMPDYNLRAPQILQRHHSPQPPLQHQSRPQSRDLSGQSALPPFPQQRMQMPMAAPAVQPPHARQPSQPQYAHGRGPSYNGPPVTQAQQMLSMTPEERDVYLAEEAKRAKRNHKIFLLSKNNGLMTPQDKNFITRIQLQQLLTATDGVDNEPGSEQQLGEDFYYQVFAQIRGAPRTGAGLPLSQFAQTYLFQTGSRYGYGRSRHHPRGGDNHVQRMEQQVARAVEAAKARPKNKSLVVEGSLGKIAFSNSKTPRPLLNIKRADSADHSKMRRHTVTLADRKAALRDIEKMYTTLMRLEDHERKLPPPPNEESPPEVIEGHMRWRSEMQELNQQLWEAVKVMEPISARSVKPLFPLITATNTDACDNSPAAPHPFIQILSHSKGKKAIPRIFRHLDDQQRLTMLTLIVIHLDVLDVIRDAYPTADSTPIPSKTREEIELFSQAVMPPLFSYVNEAPLSIIIGLLGLVLDRVHVQAVIRTKIGVSILTMLISRAELVAQAPVSANASSSSAEDKSQWSELYNRLFDTVEPVLPYIFPSDTNVSAADDVYVWQFLAAMGVGASPDQQQRLVLGVKERVMETVGVSRTLPEEMRERRLADVNLFMRAIGLDVELLS